MQEKFVVAHNCTLAGNQSLTAPEFLCKNWNGKDSPFPPCALYKEADWHTCPFLVTARRRDPLGTDKGAPCEPRAEIDLTPDPVIPKEIKAAPKGKKKLKPADVGMERLL